MKKGCLTALVLFIVLVVGVAIGVFSKLYMDEQEEPQKYELEMLEKNNIMVKTVATGSVVPRREIDIKPNVSGIVDEIMVIAGDRIKKGDVIARIKVVANVANISSAENRVNRAKIALDNAKRDFDRNKNLFDQEVIAQATFQVFQNAKENAQEELLAAKDQLQIIKKGVSSRSGKSTNTLVKSTVNGMVLDVPLEVGNSVIEANNFNDGTTVATVANMGDMIFDGKIDESEIEKLKEGMEILVSVGAIEGEDFTANLEYVSPKGVEENGAIQFDIKAAMKFPDDVFIRAGYSANANIVIDQRDSVWTISESVIQYEKKEDGEKEDKKKPFVEILVGENKYEKRDVELGLSDGIMVEVLSGINEGDEVKNHNAEIDDKEKKGPSDH
ncbi:MAG: HlyD family secretion protein [Patiriisocius sp.]|jgi:HlyD family secretion protein